MAGVSRWWGRLSPRCRRVLVSLGALVMLWCLLCIATWDGSVNIAVDYRQRMQDLQPVGPENERSWPLIRNAQSKEGEERLSLFRQAAGRARVGFRFHPSREEADLVMWPVVPTPPGLLDDAVLNVQLPHLSLLEGACKDLAADMTAAAAEGRGRRAVDDAEAIIGLARQLAPRGSTFVQQLVRWSNLSMAATAIAREVTAHPEAFTDEDLSLLSTALKDIDPAVFRLDLSVERFMMADLLQRLYTDDGDGDGSMTLETSIALRSGGIGWQPPDMQMPRWLAVLASPIHCMVAAPRSEVAGRWNEHLDWVQAEADRQPWLRDIGVMVEFEAEMNYSTWLSRLRNELFLYMTPAFGSGMSWSANAQTMAGAARLVVAAEQFRRAAGRWPQSLDELAAQLDGKIPIDPWTGAPLRLGVVDGAIRVWSLGEDRTDEGGCPAHDGRPGGGRMHVGAHSEGWFQKGVPQTDPAPAPELVKGWMAISNQGSTWPLRGDWVIWPHDPPPTGPIPEISP